MSQARDISRRYGVCLIGVDGTGKTAHSMALVAHLRRSGIKCTYMWFGFAYFFSWPFMVFCRILGYTKIHHLAGGISVSERKYYKNKAISKIWPCIQLIDTLILSILRLTSLRWRDLTVVCDRFIPDIIVDLMADVDDDKIYKKRIGQYMFRLIPKPLFTICLDVTEETAQKRKKDIPGLEYLTRRRRLYHLVSSELGIPVVNAEEPFPSVQRRLVELTEGRAHAAEGLQWWGPLKEAPKTTAW
jgi:thymidylate kinase